MDYSRVATITLEALEMSDAVDDDERELICEELERRYNEVEGRPAPRHDDGINPWWHLQ